MGDANRACTHGAAVEKERCECLIIEILEVIRDMKEKEMTVLELKNSIAK